MLKRTTTMRRAVPWIAALTAVCFVVSVAVGSTGNTRADPDTGQQIANVTFPLSVIGMFVLVVVGLAFGVVRLRALRSRS